MIGKTNAANSASGGASFSLVVSVETGAEVTASKSGRTVTGTAVNNSCTLRLPEAGTWTVTAKLNGYDATAPQTVNVVDSYAVSLSFFKATINVTAPAGSLVTCTKGNVTYQQESAGTVSFVVMETGTWTITATKDGEAASNTVNVTAATTYSLKLAFASATLEGNEWSTIKQVSDKNEGPLLWAVGDRKKVTLNGTVGSLTLSNTVTYVFILGFNHNQAYEGDKRIHLQFAKTALEGGTDIGFCDSSYNSTGSSAAFRMNTTNTNVGGWNASYMRQTICKQFENVVPADLRAVLKSVTKYTDNTGNASGSVQGNVTATVDIFFCLGEYEVFGTITYGNTYEANYQKQYDYYAAGNSKVKYRHDAITTAVRWWLRSPGAGYSDRFVFVYASGTVSAAAAYRSLAFAPGFCV